MSDTHKFSGNFTQQEGLPDAAIARAIDVMQHGRLHRYNVSENEAWSETALLETEYAAYQQQRYCLACASGGNALQLSLRAIGVQAGDPVLTNAFTLAPVPGSIAAIGARPILVESTPDLVIDTEHLDQQLSETGARVLMLSHMRGHIADMDAVLSCLEKHHAELIEDCAHTMGAQFGNRMSGSHGRMACFSTQTYKHMNSGEGGFLTSDDDELMARAVVLSGSYMLYERHQAAPPAEVFDRVRLDMPNCSGRMDNLRAAILRPQLEKLDENCTRWNERYAAMAAGLQTQSAIRLPSRHPKAQPVSSSLQFFVESFNDEQNTRFLQSCLDRGVELKWFGAPVPAAYTSRYDSWHYLESQSMPNTDALLARLYDCRLPLTFSLEDCRQIGDIIAEEVQARLA